MSPVDDPLPVIRAADIAEAAGGPRWLVDPLWARAGVGILGGAPKCCKSWLALEMALAVASGTPCLGTFGVQDAGTVLLYMAEDAAPVVKARLQGICRHRGLDLGALPVHLITAPALRLDRADDQARLRAAVAAYAPRLLVLDPFVRLHRIDENDAGQVSAVLGYLREVQREHDAAVLVVHHARKNGAGAQAGQSLRGSGDFFAWADSLLYLRRHRGRLLLTVEHRAARAPEPIGLGLAGGDGGDGEEGEEGRADVHLEVDPVAPRALIEGGVTLDDSPTLDRRILAALAEARAPIGRAELRAKVRARNARLGEALVRLAASGAVHRLGDQWAVPDSRSRAP